jgi:hypothetical protein
MTDLSARVGCSNDEPAVLQPPEALGVDFPEFESLNAAREHFSVVCYGATAHYRRPFSSQLKDEIRSGFPVDKAYYDKIDRTERSVVRTYALLRVATFILFVCMIALQVAMAAGSAFGQSGLSAFVLASIAAVIFAGLRILIRNAIINNVMEREAERLSHHIFSKIDHIAEDVTTACSKLRDRTGKGGSWPARANAWMIIALWDAKRGEYLDRYSTAAIWCVRTHTKNIEYAALGAKLAVTALAIFALFIDTPLGDNRSMDAMTRLSLSLLFAVQTVFLWHRFGQKPANFWTNAFRKSAGAIENEQDNYPAKMGAVVENLVDEVLSKEFGYSKRP